VGVRVAWAVWVAGADCVAPSRASDSDELFLAVKSQEQLSRAARLESGALNACRLPTPEGQRGLDLAPVHSRHAEGPGEPFS